MLPESSMRSANEELSDPTCSCFHLVAGCNPLWKKVNNSAYKESIRLRPMGHGWSWRACAGAVSAGNAEQRLSTPCKEIIDEYTRGTGWHSTAYTCCGARGEQRIALALPCVRLVRRWLRHWEKMNFTGAVLCLKCRKCSNVLDYICVFCRSPCRLCCNWVCGSRRWSDMACLCWSFAQHAWENNVSSSFWEDNVSGPHVYPHIDFAWIGKQCKHARKKLFGSWKLFFCKA